MSTSEWGFPIVCDLFLAGISAGIFFVSSLAALMSRKQNPSYARLAEYGAFLAPWPVMIACTILMFDLGHWWKFYKLYMVLRWTSPMSLGSWLLMAFVLVSLVYCYAWTSENQRRRLVSKVPSVFRALNHDLSVLRIPLAIIGLPMSLGVGIYTGTLLSVMPSRPFWNTSLLPQMFLISALSSGCAVLLLAVSIKRGGFDFEEQLLTRLNVVLLIVEFFLILPFVMYGRLSELPVRESMQLVLGGSFTAPFWLLFFGFGLLLPLLLQARELKAKHTESCKTYSPLPAITALMVLQGSFVLRYVLIYAGQIRAAG